MTLLPCDRAIPLRARLFEVFPQDPGVTLRVGPRMTVDEAAGPIDVGVVHLVDAAVGDVTIGEARRHVQALLLLSVVSGVSRSLVGIDDDLAVRDFALDDHAL